MTTCDQCSKHSTCSSACPDLIKILDDMSLVFYGSHYIEFPVDATKTEHFMASYTPREGRTGEENKAYRKEYDKKMKIIMNIIDNKISLEDKNIICGYYFEKLNQKELSIRHHVTQPAICYRIRKTIEEIKTYIKA
jgi:DNA-directed RNA polymerase specialized sigma subunit